MTCYQGIPDGWRGDALCRQFDAKLWFPDRGQPSAQAKQVCGMCPVRAACLAEALASPKLEGVWGGTSKKDRQKIRAGRSRELVAA